MALYSNNPLTAGEADFRSSQSPKSNSKMKDPKVKERRNLLGRDVKVTRKGATTTRQVTGEKVAKTRITRDLPGMGKKVTTSKLKVNPKTESATVSNKTKYTGLAGLKRTTDMEPSTKRKMSSTKSFYTADDKRKVKKGVESVRKEAMKSYKGKNYPKNMF